MTRFTVQCGYAAYYAQVVTVEADSLDGALATAVEQAGGSNGWYSLDESGAIFVYAVAQGADADPWDDGASALPVPPRFADPAVRPLVTIIVDGGLVRDVRVAHGPCRVLIQDYDVEVADPERVERDLSGEPFIGSRWGDWPPDPDPEIPRAGASPDAG